MPKTATVPCTREEMDRLLEVAIDDDFFYMLFKVARKTGRRIGELWGVPEVNIIEKKYRNKHTGEIKIKKIRIKTGRYIGGVQVKDIDFEKGIMMTNILKRRMRVEKEAILDDELMHLIKRYIRQNNLKLDDYLFRKVGYRRIQARITSYGKKAGINHVVSAHSFRHFFITALFKKGWTYDKIAKLTGHSTPGTLAIYDHSVASDLAEKAREDIRDI